MQPKRPVNQNGLKPRMKEAKDSENINKFNILIDLAISLSLLVLVSSYGCSSSKPKDTPKDAKDSSSSSFQSTTPADQVPSPIELSGELSNYSVQDPKPSPSPPLVADSSASPTPTESSVPQNAGPNPNPEPPQAPSPETTPPSDNERTIQYVVQKDDTLMKIAFENLGDLLRWKEIYQDNQDQLKNPNSLGIGTTLKVHISHPIAIEKNGDPYLIRPRDTLIKISNQLYGTIRRWKDLWNNNRQLIHDPNRIYAGFYLYYLKLKASVP